MSFLFLYKREINIEKGPCLSSQNKYTETKCVLVTGAKLFYLSGMKNGKYMKREVLNLARFISVMKFRPLNWRMAHPYLLTDRLEVQHVVLLSLS